MDNKQVSLYTLKNKNGLIAQVTNYGCRVVSLWTPDRDGNFLSTDNIEKSLTLLRYKTTFCIETHYFPVNPNQANFPSTHLHPGEVYQSACIYQFSVDRE
ncbi:hypothetical protein FNN09_06750 [Carboxylicivirga sp. M1479]|nr:hypothetical protein FNN09_06750 [Carboxylicivirga sp. M1479]